MIGFKSTFKTIAISLACIVGTSAVAQVTTYDCKMSSLEGRGFITERLLFTVDTERNSAAVLDGIVMAALGEPIEARFEQLNNGQYRLRWDIRNLKSGAEAFNIDYRIQFRPADLGLSIRAIVKGYDNRPVGSGSCKTVSGRSLLQ